VFREMSRRDGRRVTGDEALAFAKTEDKVKAESRVAGAAPSLEGNRPSNTKLAERVTPETLGLPVAHYEHTAFTQGRIWNRFIRSKWGVELGKLAAERTAPELESMMNRL